MSLQDKYFTNQICPTNWTTSWLSKYKVYRKKFWQNVTLVWTPNCVLETCNYSLRWTQFSKLEILFHVYFCWESFEVAESFSYNFLYSYSQSSRLKLVWRLKNLNNFEMMFSGYCKYHYKILFFFFPISLKLNLGIRTYVNEGFLNSFSKLLILKNSSKWTVF